MAHPNTPPTSQVRNSVTNVAREGIAAQVKGDLWEILPKVALNVAD